MGQMKDEVKLYILRDDSYWNLHSCWWIIHCLALSSHQQVVLKIVSL